MLNLSKQAGAGNACGQEQSIFWSLPSGMVFVAKIGIMAGLLKVVGLNIEAVIIISAADAISTVIIGLH